MWISLLAFLLSCDALAKSHPLSDANDFFDPKAGKNELAIQVRNFSGSAQSHISTFSKTAADIRIYSFSLAHTWDEAWIFSLPRFEGGALLYLSGNETYTGGSIANDRGADFWVRLSFTAFSTSFMLGQGSEQMERNGYVEIQGKSLNEVQPSFSLIPFLELNLPQRVYTPKHVNPRFDWAILGSQLKVRLGRFFKLQSILQVGSGYSDDEGKHNPALMGSQSISFLFPDLLTSGTSGVRLGIEFENELMSHGFEKEYQNIFNSGGTTQESRSSRVSVGAYPFLGLTPSLGFEVGYEYAWGNQKRWTHQVSGAFRSLF